jgi:hypothetical protein
LFTLRTLLNAVIHCSQLNTQGKGRSYVGAKPGHGPPKILAKIENLYQCIARSIEKWLKSSSLELVQQHLSQTQSTITDRVERVLAREAPSVHYRFVPGHTCSGATA